MTQANITSYKDAYEQKFIYLAQADGLEFSEKIRTDSGTSMRFTEKRGFLLDVKLHASAREGFGISAVEGKVENLVLAFMWYASDDRRRRLFMLTHAQAVAIGDAKGWTATESWKRGAYTTSKPDKELKELLAPYEYKLGAFARLTGHRSDDWLQDPTDEDIEDMLADLKPDVKEGLESLLARIESHDGPFGGGEDLKKTGDKTFEIIDAPVDPIVEETRKFLYDNNLIIVFDWAKWSKGKEIFERKGTGKFADIDASTAIRYLSAMVRSDRFGSGTWHRLFNSRDIVSLLRIILN